MEFYRDLSLADLFIFKNSKKYPVYNWVYYKEGYSPKIVDWILDYIKQTDTRFKPAQIFDPFCGVGTTLLRAKEIGIKSFGADVSPFSVLTAQIKTRNYSKEDVNLLLEYGQKLRDFIRRKDYPLAEWKFELFAPSLAFPKRNLIIIKKIKAFASEIKEDWIRSFFMVALASILLQVSMAVKDGGVIRINKRKSAGNAKELFFRKLRRMIKDAIMIQGLVPKIQVGNATDIGYIPNKLKDVVLITSPPYLNNIDYSKIYGLELSLLDFDTKEIRNRMLRSFRSKKPREFTESKYPIVDMYMQDMFKFLEKTKEKITGYVGIVVGDGVIGGEHVQVSRRLAEHLEKIGYNNVKLILGAERIADVKPQKIKVGEYLILGKIE